MIATPMPLPVGLVPVRPSVARSAVSAGGLAGAGVFAPNPVTGALYESVSVSTRSASWLR